MKKHIQKAWASSRKLRREAPLLFWLRAATVAGVVVLFIVKRNFWTPDSLFIVLLALFIVLGHARAFIIRFAPFVLVLLAYDSFRSIADDLNNNVHFWEMINADRWLFGGALPTTTLQQWWWHGTLQWYDFYFYFLYTLHFAMPILLAVLIWRLRDKLYWPFAAALTGLSFMAFITYVAFPAAPPWMASELHYIEPIHKISNDIWFAMGVEDPVGLYKRLSPNLVAAVPSLHAAYPMLFMLFLGALFGWRRVWWAMVYPVSVWIGIVYLGEHYVVDALLGILYAFIAYLGVRKYFAWRAKHPGPFKEHYRKGYNWGYAYVRRPR